MEVDSRAFPTI